MIFSIKRINDKFLNDVYEQIFNEFNEFFELNWERNKPSIIQVSDRESINALFGRKTESWIVGWADVNKVFVLDRKNYEKESNHNYSDNEYIALIKHEISHLYIGILIENGFIPRWLNEGICGYISKQIKLKKRPDEFKEFLEYSEKSVKGIYLESGFVVESLLKSYGKHKLITLLKELRSIKNNEEFKKKFKEIYGLSLEYKSFNKLLRD